MKNLLIVYHSKTGNTERLAQAALTEAETRKKTAKAQLDLANQEVKRLEGLQGSAAVSQADIDVFIERAWRCLDLTQKAIA